MAPSARINPRIRAPWLSSLTRAALALMFALIALAPAQAQVCDTPNLARAGNAVGHSTYPGYSAQRVNDGNRSTDLGGQASWVNDRGQTMTLDLFLPSAANIDRVQFFTTRGYEAIAYDIQLRIGGSWTTVHSVRGNTGVSRDDRFAPRLTDAVRIVGITGSAAQAFYFRINELEVYDCRSAQNATLRGRVLEFGTGTPVANALVDLGGGRTTTTDGNGNYTFLGLPAGTYTTRPALAGWTFGSDAFLRDRYTIAVNGGSSSMPILWGYRRNPIVYVSGWTDNINRFNPVIGALQQAGYRGFDADIQTSLGFTPPLRVNALRVRSAIDTARYETGQPRVILFAHSMGGLVARSYVESLLYRNDVSQLFSFGTPHRGAPAITGLACLPNQPAVCEMMKPSMQLFNITHGQRPGVVYHAVGGDAPMWRQHQVCFRIFGRRICLFSIPLPSFEFRNGWGWTSGLLIPGADDGLIQTYSSTGMPGYLDRMNTQEIHITPTLGSRDYYNWSGGLSGHAYWNCVHPVLVARSRSHCGSASFQFPFGGGLLREVEPLGDTLAVYNPAASSGFAAGEEYNQRSLNLRSVLKAGGKIERELLIDGSPTMFAARWSAGSARVTLVDPSGRVFDPEFAASVYDGEPQPGEPVTDKLDPDMVLYQAEGTTASYQLLAPRPGRWRMIVEGGSDIAGSTELETSASFVSPLGVQLDALFPFLVSGAQAELVLEPTSALLSATGYLQVRTIDGKVDTLPLARRDDGRFVGRYNVPDAPGNAEVSWFVSGLTATGLDFERGGSESVQIGKRSLGVRVTGAETAVPLPDGSAKRYAALEVPVEIQSSYAGAAMVSADLVDRDGQVVANAAVPLEVAVGANAASLRFAGEDLFASRRDGPYRLTNLITTDQRSAANLSEWLNDQLQTQAYDHRLFGPAPPRACAAGNLLAGGAASASDTAPGYSAARATDGDTTTAFGGQYSWSSVGDADKAQAKASFYNRLQVALPTAAEVDQVLVYTTDGWEVRDYDLEYLDGETWRLVEEVRGNVQTVREHRLPTTRIGQLRIVGYRGPDHDPSRIRINEIAAYRCASRPTRTALRAN